MKEIEEKAQSGILNLRGLAEEDMASILDELAITPITFNDLLDTKEDKESTTEVIIGEGRDVKFPLVLSHSIFVDTNHMTSANKSIRIALAYGAGMTNTPINIGEGILPEEKKITSKFKGDLLLQISPLRIGIDTKTIGNGKGIVIDLFPRFQSGIYSKEELIDRAQGKGGLIGGGVFGPERHLDIDSAESLKKHVELIREVTEYNLPVLIKIPIGAVYEDTKFALESDADAVIIDTSIKPFSTLASTNGNFGASLLGSIPPAQKAFKGVNAHQKGIKLLVSGGFRNGADILKVLALGVDAVGLVESATVALGCDLCGECYRGKCDKGIATKDPRLKSRFKWKNAGKWLANYINTTKKEIELLLKSTGVQDLKNLSSSNIEALTYDAAAITGVKLIGYDRELPMWFH